MIGVYLMDAGFILLVTGILTFASLGKTDIGLIVLLLGTLLMELSEWNRSQL